MAAQDKTSEDHRYAALFSNAESRKQTCATLTATLSATNTPAQTLDDLKFLGFALPRNDQPLENKEILLEKLQAVALASYQDTQAQKQIKTAAIGILGHMARHPEGGDAVKSLFAVASQAKDTGTAAHALNTIGLAFEAAPGLVTRENYGLLANFKVKEGAVSWLKKKFTRASTPETRLAARLDRMQRQFSPVRGPR